MKIKNFTTFIFIFLLFSVLTGKVYASEVTEKFTGQEQDANGLYYYGSRYYDPDLGRFTQPDSITPSLTSQGLNPYSYVNNNPVNNVDPSGHVTITAGNINDFDFSGRVNNYFPSAGPKIDINDPITVKNPQDISGVNNRLGFPVGLMDASLDDLMFGGISIDDGTNYKAYRADILAKATKNRNWYYSDAKNILHMSYEDYVNGNVPLLFDIGVSPGVIGMASYAEKLIYEKSGKFILEGQPALWKTTVMANEQGTNLTFRIFVNGEEAGKYGIKQVVNEIPLFTDARKLVIYPQYRYAQSEGLHMSWELVNTLDKVMAARRGNIKLITTASTREGQIFAEKYLPGFNFQNLGQTNKGVQWSKTYPTYPYLK